MTGELKALKSHVHCRTGSLEKIAQGNEEYALVHCRTGSLETTQILKKCQPDVHCRTGSYHTTNVIIYFESSFVDFYHFICQTLISTIDNT